MVQEIMTSVILYSASSLGSEKKIISNNEIEELVNLHSNLIGFASRSDRFHYITFTNLLNSACCILEYAIWIEPADLNAQTQDTIRASVCYGVRGVLCGASTEPLALGW